MVVLHRFYCINVNESTRSLQIYSGILVDSIAGIILAHIMRENHSFSQNWHESLNFQRESLAKSFAEFYFCMRFFLPFSKISMRFLA